MEKDSTKKKRKRKTKWMKFRHKVVRRCLAIFIKPLARIMYGIKIEKFMDDVRIADAVEVIINLYRRANKYIDETTPWVLAKDENTKERLETVIYNLLETIRKGAILLTPFLPETSEKIFEQLNSNCIEYDKNSEKYNVGKPYPLFERIDKEKKLAELSN